MQIQESDAETGSIYTFVTHATFEFLPISDSDSSVESLADDADLPSSISSYGTADLSTVVAFGASVVGAVDPNNFDNWIEARESVIGRGRVYDIDNQNQATRIQLYRWLNQHADLGPLGDVSDDDEDDYQ